MFDIDALHGWLAHVAEHTVLESFENTSLYLPHSSIQGGLEFGSTYPSPCLVKTRKVASPVLQVELNNL